ncbi:MAG TPA: thiamine phosphate synthase [Accumulibacter sp.]|nr:thiamine phosphate synthase [Accumulibacter sp.]HMW16500.1 thiamine phosphate synthase [Accumulibacter sp.]HMX22250.1 thiamine phosphate synthase [Accumulibacter sp.]HMY06875.1 thiamine phosphate synthase [Accumulibacter sp.]HNC16832.1 thiamine phosphate synthase [Accumulibacter sp.]
MNDRHICGPLRGLYAVTPDHLPTETLFERVDQAIAGGAMLVQYRDKRTDARIDERRRAVIARTLLERCRSRGVRLLINDDLALALAIGADGVHLGADDGDLCAARQALPAGAVLGASCYADFARARAAAAAGADYLAFGAVYPSAIKPDAPQAPLSLFTRCRQELRVASCAIGGLTADNAAPVLRAGANLLAVISDLFDASDVAARAAAYLPLFEENRHDFA